MPAAAHDARLQDVGNGTAVEVHFWYEGLRRPTFLYNICLLSALTGRHIFFHILLRKHSGALLMPHMVGNSLAKPLPYKRPAEPWHTKK